MKSAILVAVALLAGCAAAPGAAPALEGAVATTSTPSAAPSVSAPGSGSYALDKAAAAAGKPFRLEGRQNPAGQLTWKVYSVVGGATKVVSVQGASVSTSQDVADETLKFRAEYGTELPAIKIDSDVIMGRLSQAGMDKIDVLYLLTPGEFHAETGDTVQNPVWYAKKNAIIYIVDALTGKKLF
ncbi:MAG: hypothetical protein JWM80_2934 [Cyanobacteria bacterium RYN_339]|nr:hypothetical protein [Cyanobacteria bacterium RYN_339]